MCRIIIAQKGGCFKGFRVKKKRRAAIPKEGGSESLCRLFRRGDYQPYFAAYSSTTSVAGS